ncbi:UBP-type zinc finger domain-containing protein [Streptomyces sp. C36]|uniref:UBP-type zinc finger domain-containing protein n=1 Tax=Streptomyces sp. C36 TaxID=3237122 RepID=UPI0034C623BF
MIDCSHLAALPRPEPRPLTPTCPECEARGSNPVQLRLCLECGHVGCCDSSAYRHATAHFEETGHAVMRSFEPGQSWRWCYVDRHIV